jgi:hypothetical protein
MTPDQRLIQYTDTELREHIAQGRLEPKLRLTILKELVVRRLLRKDGHAVIIQAHK